MSQLVLWMLLLIGFSGHLFFGNLVLKINYNQFLILGIYKQFEFIKRKIHSDFMNHIPKTFEGTMKDWIWDILFNNKEEE